MELKLSEAFLFAPFETVAAGHPRSIVEMIAYGIDTRGTGLVVKMLRRDASPVRVFIPAPVAVDFARDLEGIAQKLGWDGNRIKDFEQFEESDWSHPETKLVMAARGDASQSHVIIGLLFQDGSTGFHRFPGDLAKALADEIGQSQQRGELLDLRSTADVGRPQ